MIRLIVILTFIFLLILGLDFYVQRIASPVESRPGRDAAEPVVPVVPRPTATNEPDPKPEVVEPPEEVETEVPAPAPTPAENCITRRAEIEFYDYDMVEQKITFEICDSVLQSSIDHRIGLKSRKPTREYVNFDSRYIEPILKSYQKKIEDLKLNKVKAAEFVVASIQNIPYTLVHEHTHAEVEDPQTFIRQGAPTAQANKLAKKLKEMHEDIGPMRPLEQPGGCLPEINYGVVTPIEMFINKMGDCDSRSTALFLVLKKLGYDVIELGSNVHQHAFLALNLPGANHGNIYYTYQGRKYYVWETTAFHPEHTRLGVHKEGALYMSNWSEWEVSLN